MNDKFNRLIYYRFVDLKLPSAPVCKYVYTSMIEDFLCSIPHNYQQIVLSYKMEH